MPVTTATLNINSADLLSDALALSTTTNLTKAGTRTGLSETSGLAKKTLSYASSGVIDTTVSHKVYIKNSSEGTSDFVTVEVGGSNVLMGRLYPGDWAFFPYDGTLDIDIDTSGTGMKVEYGVFSQSAAS